MGICWHWLGSPTLSGPASVVFPRPFSMVSRWLQHHTLHPTFKREKGWHEPHLFLWARKAKALHFHLIGQKWVTWPPQLQGKLGRPQGPVGMGLASWWCLPQGIATVFFLLASLCLLIFPLLTNITFIVSAIFIYLLLFFKRMRIFKIFILFLAVLGLHCCTWAFSSCGGRGLFFAAVRGLLIAVASCHRARDLGMQAQ